MSDMREQLPYTLTTGVTATRDGLHFGKGDRLSSLAALVESFGTTRHILGFTCMVPWPAAAERLRYRDGDPWCFLNDHGVIVCDRYWFGDDTSSALHRLAAILCDDAEAFRVLHWCIHNLPQESNNG